MRFNTLRSLLIFFNLSRKKTLRQKEDMPLELTLFGIPSKKTSFLKNRSFLLTPIILFLTSEQLVSQNFNNLNVKFTLSQKFE